MQKTKTLRLSETGLFLALGIILDTFFKLDGIWVYGGSVTLFSMLPLVVIAYRHGVIWGAFSGLAHGLITMLISGFRAGGLAVMIQENDGIKKFIFVVLLDYMLAFMAIGISGFAKRFGKTPALSLGAGAVMGLTARYVVHIISGYILFGVYAEWFFSQSDWGMSILEKLSGNSLMLVYSVIYNGLYMIPEIIITAIGGFAAGKFLEKHI